MKRFSKLEFGDQALGYWLAGDFETALRNYSRALEQNSAFYAGWLGQVLRLIELGDLETTATALIAAETGHLVIATCHTPNTLQTVERIVSLFPESQQPQVFVQMSNCLQGVLAQRLIPSADKKRRVLATELLLVNPPARKHIRDRQLHLLVNVIQMGHKEGMHLMDDSLLMLYEAGRITYDTALNYSHDVAQMRNRIHKPNQPNEQ